MMEVLMARDQGAYPQERSDLQASSLRAKQEEKYVPVFTTVHQIINPLVSYIAFPFSGFSHILYLILEVDRAHIIITSTVKITSIEMDSPRYWVICLMSSS